MTDSQMQAMQLWIILWPLIAAGAGFLLQGGILFHYKRWWEKRKTYVTKEVLEETVKDLRLEIAVLRKELKNCISKSDCEGCKMEQNTERDQQHGAINTKLDNGETMFAEIQASLDRLSACLENSTKRLTTSVDSMASVQKKSLVILSQALIGLQENPDKPLDDVKRLLTLMEEQDKWAPLQGT